MATQVTPRSGSWVDRTAGFFRGIPSFLRAVREELVKVTWPDRGQTIDATWRILVFVLFVGALIGILDFVLQLILVRGLPSIFAGR